MMTSSMHSRNVSRTLTSMLRPCAKSANSSKPDPALPSQLSLSKFLLNLTGPIKPRLKNTMIDSRIWSRPRYATARVAISPETLKSMPRSVLTSITKYITSHLTRFATPQPPPLTITAVPLYPMPIPLRPQPPPILLLPATQSSRWRLMPCVEDCSPMKRRNVDIPTSSACTVAKLITSPPLVPTRKPNLATWEKLNR
ncbi:hypothetical protein FA15DRAFT_342709 [Coprinopsis marcescibilis]|uniref:Uncharacterized protein n=1 Tax=Coprinopsis marcescibilis TaxID=230819 RepID=A0A5C3KBH7_COPMA|nr:hypothetical protein FA15DRAFT_342709 [Coprinopsis marcescibilis]